MKKIFRFFHFFNNFFSRQAKRLKIIDQLVLVLIYLVYGGKSGVTNSTDTIYNSNFNGKTIFSKNGMFCKIFTQYTYINSLPMSYK